MTPERQAEIQKLILDQTGVDLGTLDAIEVPSVEVQNMNRVSIIRFSVIGEISHELADRIRSLL